MKLNKLYEGLSDKEITMLSFNSKNIKPGAMFFCVMGATVDRHDFVDEAIEKGAIAIIYSKDLEYDPNVEYIRVKDVQKEMDRIAGIFFDHPSEKLETYAITGTNGKGSTASMIRNILNKLGKKTGYVGTINIEFGGKVFEPSITTPDILEMDEILHEMVKEGMEAVTLEASSIGIDTKRIDSIDFDVIAYTNLTHDHMDYHKNMEHYFNAKKRLFDIVKPECIMVINIDDPYGQRLYDTGYTQKCLTIAIDQKADYQATNLELTEFYSKFDLVYKDKVYPVFTHLLAKFNIYNLITAIAMIHEKGYPLEKILETLKDIPNANGRVLFIDKGQDYRAVVDYSHTPDGIKNIYEYLRSITPKGNRLMSVTGSPGGRDHSKRPIIGEVSDEYCDLFIITEQDVRHEDLDQIKDEIVQNVKKTPYLYIKDRREAMETLLKEAKPGDTVVFLGKGDEKFLYGPSGREPWPGDHVVVPELIEKIEGERNENK